MSADHWATEIIIFYFQLNSNLFTALLWNTTQSQTEMKRKYGETPFSDGTEEQYTEPPNPSSSFSRELLKDQGIEPLQNKQALQILQ